MFGKAIATPEPFILDHHWRFAERAMNERVLIFRVSARVSARSQNPYPFPQGREQARARRALQVQQVWRQEALQLRALEELVAQQALAFPQEPFQ